LHFEIHFCGSVFTYEKNTSLMNDLQNLSLNILSKLSVGQKIIMHNRHLKGNLAFNKDITNRWSN